MTLINCPQLIKQIPLEEARKRSSNWLCVHCPNNLKCREEEKDGHI